MEEEVTGTEAIQRMRNLRLVQGYFGIVFITKTGEFRKYENCSLRGGIPLNIYKRDSDLYLTFVTNDTNMPKTCFKILIRKVAFPPHYNYVTVNWFK